MACSATHVIVWWQHSFFLLCVLFDDRRIHYHPGAMHNAIYPGSLMGNRRVALFYMHWLTGLYRRLALSHTIHRQVAPIRTEKGVDRLQVSRMGKTQELFIHRLNSDGNTPLCRNLTNFGKSFSAGES
jgi:hypothetical protein